MDFSLYYISIILVIMRLEQPCHSSPVRKTRIATDKEDDELSRKIVPKSVFIAPFFSCPPGHLRNEEGRCLRIIRIDHNAQLDLIVSRLNFLFDVNDERIIRRKKDNQQSTTSKRNLVNSPHHEYQMRRPITRNKHRTDTEGPVRIELPMIK